MSIAFTGTGSISAGTNQYTQGHMAVSCWIKPSELAACTLISQWNSSPYEDKFILYTDANGKVLFSCKLNDNSVPVATSSASMTAGNWYHVAGRHYAGGGVAVYLNGAKDEVGVSWGSLRSQSPRNLVIQSGFKGEFAEAAWWWTLLSDAEILKLARGESPLGIQRGSLKTYHPCWGLSGATEYDICRLDTVSNGSVSNGTKGLTNPPVRRIAKPPGRRVVW